MNSDNLFDAFDCEVEKSTGLKSLEYTKIILSSEQRTKNCISVVTPREHKMIRALCRDLEEKFDQRVTVSDIGREFFLLLLGDNAHNEKLRFEIIDQIKTRSTK